MENAGLLLIPDISGFTKFVSETEIEHSRYIIEELLENIINSNEIGLNISEIEGDAVLFYRFGETPMLDELYKQVEKMFCNFQKKIKNFETRRLCVCQACKNAVNLSLKVITHYGEFSTYTVKDFRKLIGKDVIVAHQLLKNDIDLHEYWLVTSNLFDTRQTERLPEWINWQQGNKETENGKLSFHYSMLSRLKENVEADPIPVHSLEGDKIKVATASKTVDADQISVFSIMGNYSLRSKWQQGVKSVDEISHPIYHVGVRYRCVTDKGSKIIYGSSFRESNDTFSLTETDEKKTDEMNIKLKRLTDDKTLVTFDYYIRNNFLSQTIFSLFAKKKLEAGLQQSLNNLEVLCTDLKAANAIWSNKSKT